MQSSLITNCKQQAWFQHDSKVLMQYTYANSPGYRTNLSVSRTVQRISRIKASLDSSSTKNFISKLNKYCVYLSRMVVLLWNFTRFWFTCVHFRDFQFVRETGSKSKTQSMKKNTNRGDGVGGGGTWSKIKYLPISEFRGWHLWQ